MSSQQALLHVTTCQGMWWLLGNTEMSETQSQPSESSQSGECGGQGRHAGGWQCNLIGPEASQKQAEPCAHMSSAPCWWIPGLRDSFREDMISLEIERNREQTRKRFWGSWVIERTSLALEFPVPVTALIMACRVCHSLGYPWNCLPWFYNKLPLPHLPWESFCSLQPMTLVCDTEKIRMQNQQPDAGEGICRVRMGWKQGWCPGFWPRCDSNIICQK